MLQKAEREYQRLQNEFTIDNVFNFFVTAHHMKDYVEKATALPQQVLEAFLKDADLKDCRDLCDKGKHLRLTKRDDPTTVMWDGTIGGAPLNEIPLRGGDRWMLFTENREVDVVWLAERVITKWRAFLDQHGL